MKLNSQRGRYRWATDVNLSGGYNSQDYQVNNDDFAVGDDVFADGLFRQSIHNAKFVLIHTCFERIN